MSHAPKNQKLIPEWDRHEDEQVVLFGVFIFLVLAALIALGLGGRDGSDVETRLEIQGYTDVAGSEDSNLSLSQQRGNTVLEG